MRIRLAVTPLARLTGLLGPGREPPLLLAPARSIHTFGLRAPIDAVFLDADLRVVRVVARLPPRRVASARRACAVLELAAGTADLRPGDRLRLSA